jgi:tRNA nucleotidyltransferase (CCA-adding enzyme)
VKNLFYQGLNDLREGIIRTPLPPKETFLDDPLRVLRCVRFASRFGFSIVPEVKDAARDRTVQASGKYLFIEALSPMVTIASSD